MEKGYSSKRELKRDYDRIIRPPVEKNLWESQPNSYVGKFVYIKLPNETKPFKTKIIREYQNQVVSKKGVFSKENIVKMADGGEVGTTYQKGDRVLVKDGRVTRMATIVADGIDSNKRVRVRIDEFPFDKSIPVRPSNEIYVLEKMAKGGTMKNTKDYYKNLPKHNGYEWYSFDKGKHWFKKKEAKGYSVIKVTDKDIEDGSFEFMAQHNMSRMAKGGGVDEDREIHTFLVQVISEIGDTQYTIDANDGVQAFHKARYLFKKDNPNYNGDIDLSMIDKYAKGGKTKKKEKAEEPKDSYVVEVRYYYDYNDDEDGYDEPDYSTEYHSFDTREEAFAFARKNERNVEEIFYYPKGTSDNPKRLFAQGGLLGGFNYSIGGL